MRVIEKNSLGIDVSYVKLDKAYTLEDGCKIRSAEDAIIAVAEVIEDLDREVTGIITLKTNGTPINVCFASVGTLNASLISPREIMKTALLSNAASILMFHNHPSGGALPSVADIEVTDRINQACQIMDINFLDHIIIGAASKEWFSFTNKQLIKPYGIKYARDLNNIDIGQNRINKEKSSGIKELKVAEQQANIIKPVKRKKTL